MHLMIDEVAVVEDDFVAPACLLSHHECCRPRSESSSEGNSEKGVHGFFRLAVTRYSDSACSKARTDPMDGCRSDHVVTARCI